MLRCLHGLYLWHSIGRLGARIVLDWLAIRKYHDRALLLLLLLLMVQVLLLLLMNAVCADENRWKCVGVKAETSHMKPLVTSITWQCQ